MITFLLKGLVRDRSRSLFPILVVSAGAFLAVFAYCWVQGARNDMVWSNAAFDTGHVKITTRAYAQESDLLPNDLALFGVHRLLSELQKFRPDMIWTSRTRFAGLLDIPDAGGETRAQTPIFGLAVNLAHGSPEYRILNIGESLVRGNLPSASNDLLISEQMAQQLGVEIGDAATIISSTMHGSMTVHNFRIAGTVRFGVTAMDRGAVIADEREVRLMLDMEDASAEIVGYFGDQLFNQPESRKIADAFNGQQEADDFSPHMVTLAEQNELGSFLTLWNTFGGVIMSVFIIVMSIVLWNAGLMGSLRRYGEYGLRLAIGESKGRVYTSMLYESLLIGVCGAVIGTLFGLMVSYWLQVKGLDITSAMQNSNIMMSNIVRAQITPTAYYIGLVPGIIAPQLGAMISGIGIFKRQTAQLFKELEV